MKDERTSLDLGRSASEPLMAELVKLRKRRKIGQEPIARAMGVSQGMVSQMENLKSSVSLEEVLLYAQAVDAHIALVPNKGPKVKLI